LKEKTKKIKAYGDKRIKAYSDKRIKR